MPPTTTAFTPAKSLQVDAVRSIDDAQLQRAGVSKPGDLQITTTSSATRFDRLVAGVENQRPATCATSAPTRSGSARTPTNAPTHSSSNAAAIPDGEKNLKEPVDSSAAAKMSGSTASAFDPSSRNEAKRASNGVPHPPTARAKAASATSFTNANATGGDRVGLLRQWRRLARLQETALQGFEVSDVQPNWYETNLFEGQAARVA
uniref:Uncharacterized protein n=1 Tax=Mycena chlorophos TaxID=658473 RepID=A0ABQ0L438_MYCCL|nr:predicted protein [Mycena chlorophos]